GSGFYAWTLPTDVVETLTPKIKIQVIDVDDNTVDDESDNPFRIKGKITLNTPDGGEEWVVYTNKVISWTTVGQVNSVKLEYSIDNFDPFTTSGTWSIPLDGSPIANTPNGISTYDWNVKEPISIMMKIRVTSALDAVVTDKSALPFTTKGSFDVTQPDGSVPWKVNDLKTLIWTTNGTINKVNIRFAQDGVNFNDLISGDETNTNNISWTVLNRIMPVAVSKIRVESTVDPYPGTYADSNPFKVIADFAMVKPDGDIWTVETNRTISWTNIGTVPNVRLSFSKIGDFSDEEFIDSYVTDFNLADTFVNTNPLSGGSYSWNVWDRISASAKIRVYDAVDSTVYVPTNIFKVRGDFTIDSPAGGEAWIYNTTYPISWTT
ncbi:MAG: hypothetical protein KAS70_05725, partial [Planctomycetes bacterium]|nr:hypothetical protein [Planctomycetota bacterium]